MSNTVRGMVKSLLRAVLPSDRYDAIMAARADRHGQRVMEESGVEAVTAAFTAQHGMTVQSGPFAGMVYIEQATGSSFVPKLVGSYEAELHPILARYLAPDASPLSAIVDIGCAEGYYAVGMALRLPGAPRVFAFDINPAAQALCVQLAQRNGILDRIEIAGGCDAARLHEILTTSANGSGSGSLVVCDCEGYEVELLDPKAAPALMWADILVELHDWHRPGVTPTLVGRFAGSHDIELIDCVERDPTGYECLSFLPFDQQQVAVCEFRPGPQQWAYLRPRSRP